jgi:hypothetical protein
VVSPPPSPVRTPALRTRFREARFHQLAYQPKWERRVGLEANRPPARVVAFQVAPMRFHHRRAHYVEGAMSGRRAESNQGAIELEGRDLVPDAFLSVRRRVLNRLAKVLQRGSLVFRNGREIVIDSLGVCFQGVGSVSESSDRGRGCHR